jgi:Ankyrin repeats (3 copies)
MQKPARRKISFWKKLKKLFASSSTRMLEASGHGDVVKVKALLKRNPRLISARDKWTGDTPLHEAASRVNGNQVVELLLANGADFTAKNREGVTPLHLAITLGGKDKEEFLLTKIGATLVCRKCGVSHKLREGSFLMSLQQAVTQMAGSGIQVIGASGHSKEYIVGELRRFPKPAQVDLRWDTIFAITEAMDELKKGQGLRWMCRECNCDCNEFPAKWSTL